MSGRLFAPFISVNLEFNLYGVFERTNNEAQKHYPNIKTFRSLESLLADEAVELVRVNTPFDAIYETIRNHKSMPVAAENGRNVSKIIEVALSSHVERKVVVL